MHTIPLHTPETRSISIQAAPSVVFSFLADPTTIPRWAPDFASEIRPDATEWVVGSGDAEVRIVVRASQEHGTIDLLGATAPDRGAFMRVLPNGDGAELSFTLFFPESVGDEAIERQMTVVEGELRTVREVCESAVDEE